MQTRIEGHEGWVEVTRDGVSVLAKGDETLVERITAALDAADDDDLADVERIMHGVLRETSHERAGSSESPRPAAGPPASPPLEEIA